MAKISAQEKLNIFQFWEEHAGLTNQEKTDLYNETHGTNFTLRTLQQIHSNVNLGFQTGASMNETEYIEKQKDVLAKKEFNIMKQQKLNMKLKNVAHIEARKSANWDFFVEDWINKLKEIEPVRYKSKKKHVNVKDSDVLVIFKGDDHFRGTEEDINVQRSFYTKVEDIATKQSKKKIVLIFGGDEIEGMLHTNTLMYIDMTAEEQLKLFIRETISGIDLLKQNFDVELFFLTSSNHSQSRPLNSGRNSFLKSDLLLLGGEMLEMAYRDSKNVNIHLGGIFKDRVIDGMGGKKITITHGGLKFENKLQTIVAHYNQSDVILKAHTHSFKVENTHGKTVITVPTLKTFVTEFELDHGFIDATEDLNNNGMKWNSEFLELDFNDNQERIIKHIL